MAGVRAKLECLKVVRGAGVPLPLVGRGEGWGCPGAHAVGRRKR